jgi:hypothetical protein
MKQPYAPIIAFIAVLGALKTSVPHLLLNSYSKKYFFFVLLDG